MTDPFLSDMAQRLKEVNQRDCKNCKHYKGKRTEAGTIYGCESWECEYERKEKEE